MGDPTMTTPANDPAGTSGGDFVGEVSAKITIAVIAEMLGVPREAGGEGKTAHAVLVACRRASAAANGPWR